MDMNDRVEFVALTKEEVETMIAKAALAGASVAADTLQKAHQKEQKELKDRRLHNTRLLLRNYRMLKESCAKAVYQKEHSEKSTAEVIEDLMSMKASDGVIVNSIKESAERTGIIISHVDRIFGNMDVYFDTPHKRHVAERYRNFFLQVSAIATPEDFKHIYEGLVSGDPKMRTFRALYHRIYGKYIEKAKKMEESKHGQ